MVVNVDPARVVPPMPDPRLLRLVGVGNSLLVVDCVTLMYAIAAASSPKRWTTGLTMLTLHLLRGAVRLSK